MTGNHTDKRIKRYLKFSVVALLIACVLLSSVVSAFAIDGRWIKSGSRWWYRHTDSTYTRDGWEKIGKNWYHFDRNGWMQTGWLKDGKSWYYLNDSGTMKTGWLQYSDNWYYLDSNGKMHVGWKSVKNVWYFFNKSGSMHTGWLDYKAERYFFEKSGKMKTGWYKESGNWYYLDSSGVMVTGEITIDDCIYYFGTDGIYISCKESCKENVWYTFANVDRLNEHYEKHGVEMGYASAEDYLAGANAVINNPDALVKTETDEGDNDTIYFLEETNEIVFVSQYENIRTYFICSGKDYFDKQ